MASDQGLGRRRANSSATSLPLRQGQRQSKEAIKPKSSHTSDGFLQEFLNPSFDPASFLNAKLPPLAPKQAGSQAASGAVPVAELSAQAQTLLSQLNAQTTRLSDTLTQLADDILRSGSRLAYQVEVLRGEAMSVAETMNETLEDDIEKFIPGGLQEAMEAQKKGISAQQENGSDQVDGEGSHGENGIDPPYIKKLQTLTLVRTRLDSVIKTFGDAMDFTFPPSEVSVGSSFLSVSAPDPGSQQQSSEEKGQQVLRQLREEISNLLNKSDDPVQGIEKAANRIEELKELNQVWKGTAEEKGRSKFIDSLAKMVEDRHRDVMRELDRKEGRSEGNSIRARRLDQGCRGR